MATFFALVFFVGLIGMFLGLLKPKIFKKYNPSNSRLKIFLGGIGISIISLALVGIFAPEVEKKDQSTTGDNPIKTLKVSETKLEKVKEEESLGMTPEQFRKSFNSKLKELDIKSVRPLGEFDIRNGDARDVFQI